MHVLSCSVDCRLWLCDDLTWGFNMLERDILGAEEATLGLARLFNLHEPSSSSAIVIELELA